MRPSPVPSGIFAPGARNLFVFAHQDDELGYAGLMQRVPAESSYFIWVTNGDGLADQLDMPPRDYAAARRLETIVAMATIGISQDRLRFLGNSELLIYRTLIRQVTQTNADHEVHALVKAIAAQIATEVRAFRPDNVFTMAWQGANPEHDLIHMMVQAAVRPFENCKIYELPEFDPLTVLPLRFKPKHKDPIHEIRLTPTELEAKIAMAESYPTQDRIMNGFKVLLGGLGRVTLGKLNFERFLAVEHFGAVPRDRSYLSSPHGFDALDYIGEKCDGVPMSYTKMVGTLERILLPDSL